MYKKIELEAYFKRNCFSSFFKDYIPMLHIAKVPTVVASFSCDKIYSLYLGFSILIKIMHSKFRITLQKQNIDIPINPKN